MPLPRLWGKKHPGRGGEGRGGGLWAALLCLWAVRIVHATAIVYTCFTVVVVESQQWAQCYKHLEEYIVPVSGHSARCVLTAQHIYHSTFLTGIPLLWHRPEVRTSGSMAIFHCCR